MQTDPPGFGRTAGGGAASSHLVDAIIRAGTPTPVKDQLLPLLLREVLDILSSAAPRVPRRRDMQRYAREVFGVPEAELNAWYAQAWWGTHAAGACENRSVVAGREKEVLDLIQPVDWSLLDSELAKGRGVLICSAHWGVPYVNTILLANAGRSLTQVERWFARHRTPGTEAPRSSPTTFTQLYLQAFQRLRSGGIASIAPDGRHWRESIEERFFGYPCRVSLASATMCRLSGAPALFSMSAWEENRIRVHYSLVPPPESGGGEAADRRWMRGYLDWLEGMVRAHPRIVRFNQLLPRVTLPPEPARVD